MRNEPSHAIKFVFLHFVLRITIQIAVSINFFGIEKE